MSDTLLFLPGASGNTEFWTPVAARMRHPGQRIHLGWPGFGPTPPRHDVTRFDDLLGLVLERINGPTALIAQSMGGVLAVLAALERPQQITHLVLAATSGGLDLDALGAQDWRTDYAGHHPHVPDWFVACRQDLSDRLADVTMPTLLLWGENDPISPVTVGKLLLSRLPDAQLHSFPGGDHDVGNRFAQDIAPLIDAHLGRKSQVRQGGTA